MTAEYGPFSKNKNKGQSLSYEEKMKEWVRLIREEKEKESWSLTSYLRGLVSGRKDTFPEWLEGRNEGRANSGERREVHAGTPPQASVFPLHVEEKTHELVFAAEQIFLFPLSRLGSASSLVSSAGLQSNGLELGGTGQLGHPHQMEDCWARSEGTADALSPSLSLITWMSARAPESHLLPVLHVAAKLSLYNLKLTRSLRCSKPSMAPYCPQDTFMSATGLT